MIKIAELLVDEGKKRCLNMNWYEEDSVRRLYHGSKEGIKGEITTKIGNRHCDFGEGFYLTGTKKSAYKLVCQRKNPVVYEFELDISTISNKKILNKDINWLMVVAAFRNKLDDKIIREKIISRINSYDLVIGNIADDRLFTTLDWFFDNIYSCEVAIELLNTIDFGLQYVLKSDESLKQLDHIATNSIFSEELLALREIRTSEKMSIKERMDDIRSKHRRSGVIETYYSDLKGCNYNVELI